MSLNNNKKLNISYNKIFYFLADQLFITIKTPETEIENEKFKDMKLDPKVNFPPESDKIDDYLYKEAFKDCAESGSNSVDEVTLFMARKS